MQSIVFSGPVNAMQVGPMATLPGAQRSFVVCEGRVIPGQQTCAQIGNGLMSGGQMLPSLLQKARINPTTAGDVFLAAFSAGGSLVKQVLLQAADRANIKGVVLHDATYSSWNGGSTPAPIAPDGFVLWALDCLAGSKLFLATASATVNTPHGAAGPSLPSGSQTLAAIKTAIEQRSGVTLTDPRASSTSGFGALGALADLPVQPVNLWTYGGVILMDYGTLLSHRDHANKLASPVWQDIVTPWADAQGGLAYDINTPQQYQVMPPSNPQQGPGDVGLATKVTGAALGLLVGYLAMRQVRGR